MQSFFSFMMKLIFGHKFCLIIIEKIKKANMKPTTREIKCPINCSQSWLTVWIALFSILMALTVGTIAFVGAYSMFTKLQYKKLDKKIKANAAAAAANSVAS
jgi:hypothetical protein